MFTCNLTGKWEVRSVDKPSKRVGSNPCVNSIQVFICELSRGLTTM